MNSEAMAAALSDDPDYRVLRRLKLPRTLREPDDSPLRSGLFVDVETTGLDVARDEIIELAMVPFTYGLDGLIYEVGDAFEGLRQPSTPIAPHITAITGIDDRMVEGQVIDPAAVAKFAAPASLVIAHNAAFDRRFFERFSPGFDTKAWACSMTQVNWVEEGHEGTKLAYLAMGASLFYDRHRAAHDCAAGIALLNSVLAKSGERAMARLLQTARTPTWRIWAEGAPFDLKDILKARGYRWNAEGPSGPRAWYVDVLDGAQDEERLFLQAEIFRSEAAPMMRRVDAFDRFSDRV